MASLPLNFLALSLLTSLAFAFAFALPHTSAPSPPYHLHTTPPLHHNLTQFTVEAHQHTPAASSSDNGLTCLNARQHLGYLDACCCVLSQQACYSANSFKYVQFFFCTCKGTPALGYAGLISLLLFFFYLLGTTAADYFSCTIEKLAHLLKLSPAVAGVTLLAFGNGAPDVFSSIAAVVASGTGERLGLNSVLGGSIFVITVVSGSLGLATATSNDTRCVKLDSYSFFRDVFFFLVSLGALTWIIWDGKIHWAEALSFLGIYIVYAVVVVTAEILLQRNRLDPLLQPLLEGSVLPHVAIYAHQDPIHKDKEEQPLGFSWGGHVSLRHSVQFLYKYAIEWPLNLPRRLTIPIIQQDRWSRPYAVTSCVLAPLFLASLWHFSSNASAAVSGAVFGAAGLLAAVLGPLAFFNTESGGPPRRFQSPWLAGGFVMSVVWVYFIAQELVAVLLSLGTALNIDSSILGLTVLAWGNSVGDLVGNLCIAYNAKDGVQIAMSGCYAGPMFNTVVGLGVSSLIATWKTPMSLSEDNSLLYTILFTVVGLIWALIMVPARRMRLTRAFGIGLLFLYVGFLVARITIFCN